MTSSELFGFAEAAPAPDFDEIVELRAAPALESEAVSDATASLWDVLGLRWASDLELFLFESWACDPP